jgi:hypothetical protein
VLVWPPVIIIIITYTFLPKSSKNQSQGNINKDYKTVKSITVVPNISKVLGVPERFPMVVPLHLMAMAAPAEGICQFWLLVFQF